MSKQEVKESAKHQKERIAAQLNKILGLNIKWTRLSLEELQQLHEIFTKPAKFLAIGRNVAKHFWTEEILNRRVGELLGAEGEDKGPLGLGILPRIRRLFTSEQEAPPPDLEERNK